MESFGPVEVGLKGMMGVKMISVCAFRNILWAWFLFRIRKNLLPLEIGRFHGGCRELLDFMIYVQSVSPGSAALGL